MNLADDIIKGLKREFGFKKVGGSWLQGGSRRAPSGTEGDDGSKASGLLQ